MASLNIPPSSSTVRVAIIDTTMYGDVHPPTDFFMGPPIKGFERWNGVAFGFLITHTDANGKEQKLVFDLGLPVNWEDGLPPHFVEEGKMLGIKSKKYISEILEENGVPLDSIDSIIWSHPHLDHIGRPSLFHPRTSLIVGPDVKSTYYPGYPTVPDAPVFEAEFQNRPLVQVDFAAADHPLTIGGLAALDFFGDGSFYLLSAPGHCLGHMIALARTTSSTSPGAGAGDDGTPDSFILMSADTFHHGAQLRPSPGVPLPATIPLEAASSLPAPCPCAAFHRIHPAAPGAALPAQYQKVFGTADPDRSPFQTIVERPDGGSQARDLGAARATLAAVQAFDADPDVLVVAAHDATVAEVAELFPREANGWRSAGWKERSRWRYLEQLVPAVELANESQ